MSVCVSVCVRVSEGRVAEGYNCIHAYKIVVLCSGLCCVVHLHGYVCTCLREGGYIRKGIYQIYRGYMGYMRTYEDIWGYMRDIWKLQPYMEVTTYDLRL